MRTHPIRVTRGRAQVLEVRAELFAFPEVLDVVVTGRPDILVVICSRHPRPGAWLVALRAAGYEIPARFSSVDRDRANEMASSVS